MKIQDALDMYEAYKTYWHDNYKEARFDLRMASGDPEAHWGDDVFRARSAAKKSVAIINQLPQFIHQVTNDIRQNVPSLKALPDTDGDIKTAEVIADLFRAIEYRSHSDEVVDTAAEYAVKCGIGFMAAEHDYCDDDSDEQEILFKVVPDPLVHFMDPSAVEYDGRDSNGHVELVPITKAEFERQYPGKKFTSFTDPLNKAVKDSIVLGQIHVREFGGSRGKKITVHRYLFSGEEKLAETTFPGKYIPRVPVFGEVTWINGKRIVSSLIRQARGPSLRLQHWAAKESEILNMAPIAPVMAVQGTLVNDRGQWQSPGAEMVLEYTLTDTDGNPSPQPTRLQPPPIPTGIVNAMEGAKLNIKESMGIYNAGLGKREGDASGRALEALDRSGDVATFHFPDNVRRSYGHLGEIAFEMIPIIYDTPRVLQVMNEESDVRMVGVNGAPQQEGQQQDYDLTKGKYSVRISTGASYTTKRQEEGQFLLQIAQKDPTFMQIGGDILFKSLDSPGSQALAERYKTIIQGQNPGLIKDDQSNQDPRVMQMQQVIQQGQQQMQALQGQLAQMEQQKEMEDLKEQIDTSSSELQLNKKIAELEIQLQEKELELKAQQLFGPQQEKQQSGGIPEGFAITATPEHLAMQDAHHQNEMAMQQQGLAVQQQTTATNAQLAQAVIGAINGLTAAVQAPKSVQYDEQGNIMGVH